MSENYYIIENSGESRQVWGPYATLMAARKKCGKRHVVVTGDGLTNGLTMPRGHLREALDSRRIVPVDPAHKASLA